MGPSTPCAAYTYPYAALPCIYTLVPEYLRLLGTREILLADYLSVQEIFSHLPTKIFLVHFSNQQVQVQALHRVCRARRGMQRMEY